MESRFVIAAYQKSVAIIILMLESLLLLVRKPHLSSWLPSGVLKRKVCVQKRLYFNKKSRALGFFINNIKVTKRMNQM